MSLSSLCPVHAHGPFFIHSVAGTHSQRSCCFFFTVAGTHSRPSLLIHSSCQFFAVCSLVGRWTVALFRRLFHQSVAGLLSCSLLLTASSQLKPFVFCIAVCSPVGRRTVVFLLLSLQMPGTHSTGQLLSSAPSRKFLIVVVACLQTRSSSSSFIR